MGATRKALKATFTLKKLNGKRFYAPVNKRAKSFTLLANTNLLTIKDLRLLKQAGYRPYIYLDGKLKAVSCK